MFQQGRASAHTPKGIRTDWTITELSDHKLLALTVIRSERSRYNMVSHSEKIMMAKLVTATQKHSILL